MATTVTVTGAAGQIGYALLFRIASGQMLGPDEKIELRLLEIPDAVKAAEGTALELFDCAFPLLASVDIYDDPKQAFDGTNIALLVGARFPAMTRLDHNRAVAQLADKTGAQVSDITNMAVWGNHSPTMYPDLFNAKGKGERAWDVVGDEAWGGDEYIPTVGKRGAA